MKLQKHLFHILFFIVSLSLSNSCVDILELDKYKRPVWLEGKLYTQIAAESDLTQFTTCLELTGYDTIIDISGSFTVFAPTDDAFDLFFQQNPGYGNQVSNIPQEELERIVKFHIIQNAWSREQLQSLDIYGWIDKDDPGNDKPRGFKRQTLLRDDNKKYWVHSDKGVTTIVDSAGSNTFRKVFTKSRKYVPIFFDDYFTVNNLKQSDFDFYFNRPYSPGNIYFSEGKVTGVELFAENGFIFKIDRVTTPLLNAEQLLQKDYPGVGYKSLLSLLKPFPEFTMNLEETYKQPEAKEGKQFDTLYNLIYQDIVFNIHEELSGPNINEPDYTVRYHNAILAPTDAAFQTFIDEVLTAKSGYPRWGSFNAVPKEIKKIIANTHMGLFPVYKTNIDAGFENGVGDIIRINEENIVNRYYGSNCTFIGLNEVIIPRAFSSVSAPVYLRPGYSIFMYAMEYTKVLPAIKREDAQYSFYVIPDMELVQDSSLMLVWDDIAANRYRFRVFNRSTERVENLSKNDLAKQLLNQVGISVPTGIPRKEFIENLAGNYIVINNENQTITGGSTSVFGYLGDSVINLHPVLLEEPTDNGKSYSVTSWFVPARADMYSRLTSYTKFLNLTIKAGLYNTQTYKFTFLTEGENYTVFIPSEQALISSGADNLSLENLRQFIKYHFIRGELIFTDGKKPSGLYETLRVDETSTPFSTRYSTVNIRTSVDKIEILDANGTPYLTIPEAENKTNIFIATDTDNVSISLLDYITTGVIHEIDNVLVKQ